MAGRGVLMGGHGASHTAHLRNFARLGGTKGFLKYRVAPGFDDDEPPHKFPMYVMPIDRAIEVTALDRELPCHEDLKDDLVEYEPSTMPSCLFFSHTWLRYAHPDNEHGVKRRLIHGLLTGIKAGTVGFSAYWFAVVSHHMKDIAPRAVSDAFSDGYVWLDYWAIPQRDHSSQARAIQSIPHYVASTHAFIVLAGPWIHEDASVRDLLAWNGRGWCRMEQVATPCPHSARGSPRQAGVRPVASRAVPELLTGSRRPRASAVRHRWPTRSLLSTSPSSAPPPSPASKILGRRRCARPRPLHGR